MKLKLAVIKGFPDRPSPHLPYGSLASSYNIAESLINSSEFEQIDFYNEYEEDIAIEFRNDCKVRKVRFTSYGEMCKNSYDLIYLSGGHFMFDSYAFRTNNLTPVISEIGTTHNIEQWKNIFLAMQLGNLTAHDGFIFKSRRTQKLFDQVFKDWSRKFGSENEFTTTYLPNGVDVADNQFSEDKRSEFRNTFKLDDDAILFLTFSRIAPHSKIDYESLLYAWREVVKSNSNSILVISGAIVNRPDYSKYPDELLELAKTYGVYNNVRVIANPYDLWDDARNYLMSGCDVFIHTTRGLEETTSNVVLEALSHSLPVIASNWSGMPDIIQEGNNGYLIDTWVANAPSPLTQTLFSRDPMVLNAEIEDYITVDNEKLIQLLKVISCDKKLLEELRINARKSVVEGFEINKITKKRIDFFRKVTAQKKASKVETGSGRHLVDINQVLEGLSNKTLNDETKLSLRSEGHLNREKDVEAEPDTVSERIYTLIGLAEQMRFRDLLDTIIEQNHGRVSEEEVHLNVIHLLRYNLIRIEN